MVAWNMPPQDANALCRCHDAERLVGSAMQVAINWCISKGCVPIPGAKTLAMAKDNIATLSWRLSPAEEAALDSAAAGVNKGMVQNIFQTA